MAHAICTARCYYGNHEFLVGDILNVGEGEIPTHFSEASEDDVKGKRVITPAEPALKAASPSAAERAQAGEPVAFSELNGPPKTKEPVHFSDLI